MNHSNDIICSRYFIEEAEPLIKQSLTKENRLITPKGYNLEVDETKIKLKENFLKYNLRQSPLSTNEMKCLYYLAHGETAKSTARKLGISHRTVEKHFENIRLKLKCCSKSQLIDYYHNHLSSIPSNLFIIDLN